MLVTGALLVAGPAVAQTQESQDIGTMSDAEYYQYYSGGYDTQNETDNWFFDYYGWDTEALESGTFEPQAIEPEGIEPQALEPQPIGPEALGPEPLQSDPTMMDDPTMMESEPLEPQYTEPLDYESDVDLFDQTEAGAFD
jgi:hypothetical protein